MIASTQRKKTGPIRGCLIPIVGLAGFLALCYMLCFVIYLLNIPFIGGTTTGGMLLPPLH